MQVWRLIDTSFLSAADSICLDDVLTAVKNTWATPNTFRFFQLNSPAALVGLHQVAQEEINIPYCKQAHIAINRRITGGEAAFITANQLNWSIYIDKNFFDKNMSTSNIMYSLSAPIVNALKNLGVKSEFDMPNGIYINNHKIAEMWVNALENVFMIQGMLHINSDIESMLNALYLPRKKLKEKTFSAISEKITCLENELHSTTTISKIKHEICHSFEKYFKVKFTPSDLTDEERGLFAERTAQFHSETWLHSVPPVKKQPQIINVACQSKAGLVRFSLECDPHFEFLKRASITGDFLSFPGRTVHELEALLRGIPLDHDNIYGAICDHLGSGDFFIPGMRWQDFLKPLDLALHKIEMIRYGLPPEQANRTSVTNGSFAEILKMKPSVLLLPYCAKPLDCVQRRSPQCGTCGHPDCTVGQAWSIGRSLGMRCICVVNYESLWTELINMRLKREEAFIGFCCQSFFIKHADDFKRADIPGILLDINNTTCYDYGMAREAYAGTFAGQTTLDIGLLEDILRFLPSAQLAPIAVDATRKCSAVGG